MRKESSLKCRSIAVSGHKTTVRLADQMWDALRDVSMLEGSSVNEFCTRINDQKQRNESLTSALRVYLMLYYRDAAEVANEELSSMISNLPRGATPERSRKL